MSFYLPNKTGVQIQVRLTPNARQTSIDGPKLRDDGQQVLHARVTAVPDKGKANKALIALLAKTLNISKSSIFIKAGHTSRQKTIQINGNIDELSRSLNELAL